LDDKASHPRKFETSQIFLLVMASKQTINYRMSIYVNTHETFL